MAKKKTAEKAKIEAAPVLRAQNDDPTPETPVITKSYIMRDDWIDKGVVNTVAFKSVDGEVQDLLVNGEPAGGGGGLAEVTINNTTAAEIEINMIYVDSENLPPFIGAKYVQGVYVDASSSVTVQAPTAGDYNKALCTECTITAATGDIELNATYHYAIIRGTGTITVS